MTGLSIQSAYLLRQLPLGLTSSDPPTEACTKARKDVRVCLPGTAAIVYASLMNELVAQ